MSTRLMKILNFTQEDLTYNRRGERSPQHEALTNRKRRRTKLVILIVGMVLLAIAAVWTVLFLRQEELSARIVAVAVGLLLFGLPGLFAAYLGVRPTTKKIPVERIEGRAKVARVEHTISSNKSTSKYVRTEIHIAGKVYPVPDEAFSELEDAETYAIYAWKDTDHIFSLEKL